MNCEVCFGEMGIKDNNVYRITRGSFDSITDSDHDFVEHETKGYICNYCFKEIRSLFKGV